MKRIENEEMMSICLSILKQVDVVCRKNGFRYSLGYGTLLGAIRHKGFIPWDNDIDIVMPRPDYNRFVDYCNNHRLNFSLATANTFGGKYRKYFAKAYAPDTLLIEDNSKSNDAQIGVNIDIFPIDGLGNTYEEAKENFSNTEVKREILIASNWKAYKINTQKSLPYNLGRFGAYIFSRTVSSLKLIEDIQTHYAHTNFNQMNYVGCVCTPYRAKEIFNRDIYTEFINVEFEGESFMAIKEYDVFLKQIYGNYMELPPIEKRVPPHDTNAYYR